VAAAKARQRSLLVHRCDRAIKPQAVRHCGEATSCQRSFQAAISLQQRRCTSRAYAGRPWHLVGRIAAQRDEIRNLFRIDAIPRANFGGTHTCHFAGTDGIESPVFFEINSRVINGHPIANEGCLLHPQKRTCSASAPMSAKCQ
jgi:hypothetical protein